jgi:LmbE family N-acetylglucosaminyl deacetylase
MVNLSLGNQQDKLKILCIGAHCDDIEIGCGGTIMRMSEEHQDHQIKWLILTSTPERSIEANRSAEYFLKKFKKKEVSVKEFKDGFLPYSGDAVKKLIEKEKEFQPDLIFTHYRNDRHQDHRLLNELTWNTFRDHLILEYEIPKYDGDLGNPNCFTPLNSRTANDKVKAIMDHYPSQANKHWFDGETFFSLMRIRAMESAARTKYAEAFYIRKCVL